MGDILSFIFYQPIVNLLLLLYKVLFENLGLAVIAITIFIRLALWPIYKKQLQAQERIKKIQPKIKEIQAKKKKPSEYTPEERELLTESTKAAGAGCLPTLVQLPFLWSLYGVISTIIGNNSDSISKLAYFDFLKFPAGYHYNTNFLGIDLSNVASHIGLQVQVIPYLVIILLAVIAQWYSMKVTMMNNQSAVVEKPKEDTKKKNKKNQITPEKKEPTTEDVQALMNKQMTVIFPLLIGFFAWSFAAILPVYWIMQNLLAIIQTLVHNRKLPWMQKQN